MQEKGIEVMEDAEVIKVEENALYLANRQVVEFDECLWCTQAKAPAWLEHCRNLPLGRVFKATNVCH